MKFLTLPLLLVSLPLSRAETTFSVDSVSCVGGPYLVTSLEVTCGNNLCTWGSTALLEGLVTLQSDLIVPGRVEATAASGLYNVYSGDFSPCPCMTPMDASITCPSAGDYAFTYDYQVPDKGWYAKLLNMLSMAVVIKADFDFQGSATTTCTMMLTATKTTMSQGQGYQMASTVRFVGGAILLVGVAALGLKKRRVATIQLQEEEDFAKSLWAG